MKEQKTPNSDHIFNTTSFKLFQIFFLWSFSIQTCSIAYVRKIKWDKWNENMKAEETTGFLDLGHWTIPATSDCHLFYLSIRTDFKFTFLALFVSKYEPLTKQRDEICTKLTSILSVCDRRHPLWPANKKRQVFPSRCPNIAPLTLCFHTVHMSFLPGTLNKTGICSVLE